jgi:hypothetical protein
VTEQSLAELAGHDLGAMSRLEVLSGRYRREGITGLRAATDDLVTLTEISLDEIAVLLAEAVLTIAERTGTTAAYSRRAWERLDAEDARTEQQQIDEGGNR